MIAFLRLDNDRSENDKIAESLSYSFFCVEIAPAKSIDNKRRYVTCKTMCMSMSMESVPLIEFVGKLFDENILKFDSTESGTCCYFEFYWTLLENN